MSSPNITPDDSLDPIQQQELTNGVARALVNSVPPGWSEITLDVISLARLTAIGNWVSRNNNPPEREFFPHSVNNDVIRLRLGMYREGTGTWFSMRMHIIPPGRFKVEFNYDEKPTYFMPPDPQEFATDFEKFPRSPENIPSWLQEELDHASREE